MAVRQATHFEMLTTLHTLWKNRDLEVQKIKTILKESYDLELTALTNSEITAQSLDGKTKYSIK
jgi:hypothetical protein